MLTFSPGLTRAERAYLISLGYQVRPDDLVRDAVGRVVTAVEVQEALSGMETDATN